MGTMDRVLRGTIGGALLTAGVLRAGNTLWNVLMSLIGGTFVFYSVTGHDPLLTLLGKTTKPESENRISPIPGSEETYLPELTYLEQDALTSAAI